MTRQAFDTTDVLRLQVEAAGTVAGRLPDLVPNTDGELGGWGWLSPVENTTVDRDTTGDGLRFKTLAAQAAYFTTELMPVEAGTHVFAEFRRVSGLSSAIGVRGRLSFYDAAAALISETAQTALVTADAGGVTIPATALPAGTEYIKLRIDVYRSGGNLSANDWVVVTAAHVATGTATQLAGTIVYDAGWLDILGSSNTINVDRAELNLGTLTATIVDAALDPSQSEAIRTGKGVRLLCTTSGIDEPLFTGKILRASVTYDLPNPNTAKRARIELSAVDQAQPLANTKRAEGVAAIGSLPYVFEGCGVPWNVNGNTGHTATTPPVVAVNENAYAVDQVAITRDSNLGYAWFDRRGVVQVWDAVPATSEIATPLNEDVYNPGIVVDYDTDRCINHVTVKYLRTDPATGETVEVDYGPYLDRASIRRWGTHAAEFTVQGINDDEATIAAYAASILAANSTPAVRIIEVTIPLNTVADLNAWALLDLYDLPTVSNTAAGISEAMRVTRLSHRITGDKWLLVVGFTTDGGVAQPQVTPSPPGTQGQTLSELLRPVGEVTMWYGSTAQIPAGWLRCDGAAIPADYPDLIALIGANTPNMVDVFPIGAGTKALGTGGGNPTKVIAAGNLPPHAHTTPNHNHPYDVAAAAGTSNATLSRGTATVSNAGVTGAYNPAQTGGGNTGNGPGASTPLDVMNPWRALHFIIRAR